MRNWNKILCAAIAGLVFLASMIVCIAQNLAPQDTNVMIQLMTSQAPVDISSPPVASATFDPPVVRPGELAVYRITVNAIEAAIKFPEKIAAPKELQLQATTHGQVNSAIAGMIRPISTFNHETHPTEAGLFSVPSFYIEVAGKPVLVPEAWLEARDKLPPDHEPARRLIFEVARTNVFVGENFPVRVMLSSTRSNTIEGLSQLQINGDGLVADKNFRASIEPIPRNGRALPTLIYQTTVRPIAPGQLKISAQGFTAGNEFGAPIVIQGRVTIPGGVPRYVLLDSEPVTMNVRALPPGRPDGFTGAVGEFTCDPPRLSTNSVRAGDPVRLSFIIRGEDGLNQLVAPPAPRVPNWQIFTANEGGIVSGMDGTNAGVMFNFTMIPLTTDIHATPPIPFATFDPNSEKFVDLTIPSVPITVTGENLPADWIAAVNARGDESGKRKKISLSALAPSRGVTVGSLTPVQQRGWFPFVQFAPLLVFVALWQYERRRRFLEAHPEIVRRRRARRELRRQRKLLKRAASQRNAEQFVSRAIASLQVACAPHYPAEPRALVCGEVQNCLPERNGDAVVVQRFFDAANALRFGPAHSANELFSHERELDSVLAKLEERLCD